MTHTVDLLVVQICLQYAHYKHDLLVVANARLFGFLDLILQLPHLGVLPMGEYGNIQLVQPTIQWYIFIATHMIGYQSHLHVVYIP